MNNQENNTTEKAIKLNKTQNEDRTLGLTSFFNPLRQKFINEEETELLEMMEAFQSMVSHFRGQQSFNHGFFNKTDESLLKFDKKDWKEAVDKMEAKMKSKKHEFFQKDSFWFAKNTTSGVESPHGYETLKEAKKQFHLDSRFIA